MYAWDWIPPKAPERHERHIHDDRCDGEDASVARPLMAMVAVVAISVGTMFLCDHVGHRLACVAHATVEPC